MRSPVRLIPPASRLSYDAVVFASRHGLGLLARPGVATLKDKAGDVEGAAVDTER